MNSSPRRPGQAPYVVPGGWRSVSRDPNSQASRDYRRRQLEAAWADDGRNRVEIILSLCQGRTVLDVGCVNHEVKDEDPLWLHPKIAAVSGRCVGLDNDLEGVEAMRARGFDVVAADVSDAPAVLAAQGPFDVVVAGEVIEHLDAPIALLRLAREVLVPGGTLVITTPNPYAPWRVRSGHQRRPWENVDHVAYLFPGGIAELADRSGMALRLATTVDTGDDLQSVRGAARDTLRAVWHRLHGVRGDERTGRLRLPLDPTYFSPLDWVARSLRSSGSCMGESAVYLLETPADTA